MIGMGTSSSQSDQGVRPQAEIYRKAGIDSSWSIREPGVGAHPEDLSASKAIRSNKTIIKMTRIHTCNEDEPQELTATQSVRDRQLKLTHIVDNSV